MGMVAPTGFTAEAVRAFPNDGNRYEVVDGELLVTPSPGWAHQRALCELVLRLAPYIRAHDVGEVLFSPADIELGPRTLVQPDVFVTRKPIGGYLDWSQIDLLLVVEVLSPSTASYDRLTKRLLYQRQGVEYWIIDIDAHVVERWMPDDERPEVLANRIEWRVPGTDDGCVIDLEEYFKVVTRVT